MFLLDFNNYFLQYKLPIILVLFLSFCLSPLIKAQHDSFEEYGYTYYVKMKNSPFPHKKRANGYKYYEQQLSYLEHYSDNTTAIFVPKYFKDTDSVDIYIHFHGWYNNVDSTLHQFGLVENFYASKKNAILIVPEGPKNAPDSFYGNLESFNGFKKLIDETIQYLYDKKIVSKKKAGNIVISGHSGAFRVISYILLRGGMQNNIKEVYLFDGMYGHLEKYTHWMEKTGGKFVTFYADTNGTRGESERLMENLIYWDIPFRFTDQSALTYNDFIENKILIVFTHYMHDEVIYKGNNLLNCLRSSCLR